MERCVRVGRAQHARLRARLRPHARRPRCALELALRRVASAAQLKPPRFLQAANGRRGSTGSLDASDAEMDEAEREWLACVERRQIVAKYDKGTEGQQVDPWENPNFELYKVTDRYGFVHDEELPSTSGRGGDDLKTMVRRQDKWLRMLGSLVDRNLAPPKLRSRVWKGVPDRLRAEVWTRLLRVPPLCAANVGTYERLLVRARLLSDDVKQIDLDINRTYRDHVFFRRRYDIKQRSLFNVLSAYSMYNSEVGYCQGMSQIAALLLMYMDEEDAFWTLHLLMCDEMHSMHGLFKHGFPKLHRLQVQYEKILSRNLSRLKKHLDKLQVPSIYLTKWFFGCFLDRVPFTLALRLWDVYILEGDSVLIGMAYNVMKMHQKTLRNLDFEQLLQFLQDHLAVDFGYSDDEVMVSLQECMRKLRSEKMLSPPAPTSVEGPTQPFGASLGEPVERIERRLAELQGRASSRAGRSVPTTPSRAPAVSPQNGPAPPPLCRPPSVYENLSAAPNDDAAHLKAAEERRSFERVDGRDGTLTLESKVVRCVTLVDTHTRTTLSPSVRVAGNNVTYVTVEPTAHPSLSSRRFPVSPTDFAAAPPLATRTASAKQTVV